MSEPWKTLFVCLFTAVMTMVVLATCEFKSCELKDQSCVAPRRRKCETWMMPTMIGDITYMMPMENCECVEGADK